MRPIYELAHRHARFNLSYFSSKLFSRTKSSNGYQGFNGANVNHHYRHPAQDTSYSQGHEFSAQDTNRGLDVSAQEESADSASWAAGDGTASIVMGDIVVQRGWEVHHGVAVAKLRGNDTT